MVNWLPLWDRLRTLQVLTVIVDAKRQVGSLLKPIIYLNALESGRYTWASPIEDTAISIPIDGDKSWTLKIIVVVSMVWFQCSRLWQIHTTFLLYVWRTSLAYLHSQISLRQFGVSSDIPAYPSIYLGAVNMSPMEVLSVYGNFATGGFK